MKTNRATLLVTQHQVTLEGEPVPYCVKVSARARQVRLEVKSQQGLIVVVPRSFRGKDIPELLQRHRSWILHQLANRKQLAAASKEQCLNDGHRLLYLGLEHELVVRQSYAECSSVTPQGRQLVVNLDHQDHLEHVIEHWYREQASKVIGEKVENLAAKLELSYNRFGVRRARTRWGSCSQKGNLSFNWKLVMAPEAVIDYVIIHELIHLKELNHSVRFWRLVEECCPDWRTHKKWLKDHHAELDNTLPVRSSPPLGKGE
ncbi:MAG: M48 family metallopeptidase [Chloroflexi bacterium]|nr:M48 family metallopeptidase [Chloroflexota bacterium]